MLDGVGKVVEIQIVDTTVWVNVDGVCAVRIQDAKAIKVEDSRGSLTVEPLAGGVKYTRETTTTLKGKQ